MPQEFAEVKRHKKAIERLEEEKEKGNSNYVRFISGVYMLEVRRLSDLTQ